MIMENGNNKFCNVAHRGASAYIRENTLASFAEAIARHADMIELDVRMTSDGVLVLFHDGVIKDINGRKRPIAKTSFSDIKSIALKKNFPITTLEETLQIFGNKIPLAIEIKIGGYEDQTVRLLQKYPTLDGTMVSSFYPWTLVRIKRLDPTIKTALILGYERMTRLNFLTRPIIQKLVSSLGVKSIHLQKSIITESVIRKLYGLGVTVFVWTVDEPEAQKRFLKIGVKGIITNKPDVLYDVCSALSGEAEPLLRPANGSGSGFVYAEDRAGLS